MGLELEFRNKNGVLFGTMSGVSAKKQYGNIIDSNFFEATRKQLKTKNQTEYTAHLVFVCVEDCKIFYGELELWFEKGDYIKIK